MSHRYHNCRNWKLAEHIMLSPIGQLALKEGVGLSLWMRAWRDGDAHFTERDVQTAKQAVADSARRVAELTGKPNVFISGLIQLFDAMQGREKELFKQYARAA